MRYRASDLAKIKRQMEMADSLPEELEPLIVWFDMTHRFTGMPLKDMARHQHKIWNAVREHRCVMCIKGKMTGISTIGCLKVMQMAHGPCRGKSILVVGPNKNATRDIMRKIRSLHHGTPYECCVIDNHVPGLDDGLMPSMITTDSRIYLRNLHALSRPTEILSASISSLADISGHNACFVYASDITQAGISPDKLRENYAAMVSSLGMRGHMLIETPPGMTEGPVWEHCRDLVIDETAQYAAIGEELRESRTGVWACRVPTKQSVNARIITPPEHDAMIKASSDPEVQLYAFFSKGGTNAQRIDLMNAYMNSMNRKRAAREAEEAPRIQVEPDDHRNEQEDPKVPMGRAKK